MPSRFESHLSVLCHSVPCHWRRRSLLGVDRAFGPQQDEASSCRPSCRVETSLTAESLPAAESFRAANGQGRAGRSQALTARDWG